MTFCESEEQTGRPAYTEAAHLSTTVRVAQRNVVLPPGRVYLLGRPLMTVGFLGGGDHGDG